VALLLSSKSAQIIQPNYANLFIVIPCARAPPNCKAKTRSMDSFRSARNLSGEAPSSNNRSANRSLAETGVLHRRLYSRCLAVRYDATSCPSPLRVLKAFKLKHSISQSGLETTIQRARFIYESRPRCCYLATSRFFSCDSLQ
jgi:hypothetical protein